MVTSCDAMRVVCRAAQSNLMYFHATACNIMQRRPKISSVFYCVFQCFPMASNVCLCVSCFPMTDIV